jgi:hypothetical protein
VVVLKCPELRQAPARSVDKKLYWQHLIRHLDNVIGPPVELDICLDRARVFVRGERAEIELRVEESEFQSECADALGAECSVRRRARWVKEEIVPGLVAGRSVDDVLVGELPTGGG